MNDLRVTLHLFNRVKMFPIRAETLRGAKRDKLDYLYNLYTQQKKHNIAFKRTTIHGSRKNG